MTTTAPDATRATRRFHPQLEGMRALAAIGVLTTHVAFQTRTVTMPVIGPALGRLDLAVALFFGLSGFLLWRPWVAAAYGHAATPPVRRYLARRIVRIWPAYVVVVVLVLTLLPDAKDAHLTVWLANLTLSQVFVPLSLTAGLTQMWSLSVEVAFYALLPIIGYGLLRLRVRTADDGLVRWRIPALLGLGVLSLGWAWVAVALPVPGGVEPKNWVIGHLPWFISGLLLAELVGAVEFGGRRPISRLVRAVMRLGSRRLPMLALLVVAYALACTRLGGPTGLGAIPAWQFATKILLGALCGFALLAPLICGTGPFRFLASRPMLALGRWSYGIFIWHLVVLSVVFPLFGLVPFDGNFALVWVITVAVSIGVSAASYAFVEEPARRWLRARERRDSNPPVPTPGPKMTSHTVEDTAISAGS